MSGNTIPEVYADGVFDIGFANGMVRVDLFSLSATERDDEGRPTREVRQRVVMNAQGFLDTLGTMQRMAARLQEAGVLRRREEADDTGDTIIDAPAADTEADS